MGFLGTAVTHLDGQGFRKLTARLASLVYGAVRGGRQSFSVDESGRWVNHQPEATIVNPIAHTTSYVAYREWVLDNWCWKYVPQSGDTVIDVGAGIGEEAVVFSHLVGARGRVISIEAHPGTFACLQETIRRSHLSNVTALNLALGERDGIATISNSAEHLKNSIVAGEGATEVPMRSLDSLARELGIGLVALLKMNIEGAERFAVPGMRESSPKVAHLCISCHDFLADRGDGEELRSKREVRAALLAFGYQLSTRPDHPDPWVRDYFYGSRAP